MYTDDSGIQAHGRTSPLRIDPSTMLAVIVIVAAVVVVGLHLAFRGNVSAGFSVSR